MFLVKSVRLARGLSQKQVAKKTGIRQTYISGIECGVRVPQGNELDKLAKFYNVDPSRLLTHVADPGAGLEYLDAEANRS